MMQESDDTTFLGEINEMSSTISLKDSRPQRLIEWPEFMAMRCQVAKGCLKTKIRNAANLRIYGFVASLPLYSFDIDKHPLFRRPALSEVKSPPFKEFVEYVHGLGFSCFIDRPGLDSWCNQDRNKAYSSRVDLSDFGLYDFQYFDAMGAPKSQRHDPPDLHWTLYVLLPGQEAPNFSLKRYFKYNQDSFSVVNFFLKVFLFAGLICAGFAFPLLMVLSTESEQYHGNPLNKVLESIESQL